MLETSDFSVEETLQFFTAHDMPVGLIVPTGVGIAKGIMDAHAGLRRFLFDAGVHDFDAQLKGPDHKVIVDALWVQARDVKPINVSLYRPQTKDGDPRTWIYGLASLAAPGNLIAWLVIGGRLYLVNVSNEQTWASRLDPDTPFGELVAGFSSAEDLVARELLTRVQDIASRGWIPSGRRGDTGVGYTLETELGIAANSRQEPDYDGVIELKAGRARARAGRKTLFSKTPDWSGSQMKTAARILESFGKAGPDGRQQLYCTIHSRPNPDSLFNRVVNNTVHCMSDRFGGELHVIQWPLDRLEAQLAAKHASTFWVEADVCLDPYGTEHFNYRAITHTRSPITTNLGPLIATGKITVDLTLSTRASGAVRDHGYLFRTAATDLNLIFPPPTRYELSDKLSPL